MRRISRLKIAVLSIILSLFVLKKPTFAQMGPPGFPYIAWEEFSDQMYKAWDWIKSLFQGKNGPKDGGPKGTGGDSAELKPIRWEMVKPIDELFKPKNGNPIDTEWACSMLGYTPQIIFAYALPDAIENGVGHAEIQAGSPFTQSLGDLITKVSFYAGVSIEVASVFVQKGLDLAHDVISENGTAIGVTIIAGCLVGFVIYEVVTSPLIPLKLAEVGVAATTVVTVAGVVMLGTPETGMAKMHEGDVQNFLSESIGADFTCDIDQVEIDNRDFFSCRMHGVVLSDGP